MIGMTWPFSLSIPSPDRRWNWFTVSGSDDRGFSPWPVYVRNWTYTFCSVPDWWPEDIDRTTLIDLFVKSVWVVVEAIVIHSVVLQWTGTSKPGLHAGKYITPTLTSWHCRITVKTLRTMTLNQWTESSNIKLNTNL